MVLQNLFWENLSLGKPWFTEATMVWEQNHVDIKTPKHVILYQNHINAIQIGTKNSKDTFSGLAAFLG